MPKVKIDQKARVRRTHRLIRLPTPPDRALGIPLADAGLHRTRGRCEAGLDGERWIASRGRTRHFHRSLPHLNVATLCDTGDARVAVELDEQQRRKRGPAEDG